MSKLYRNRPTFRPEMSQLEGLAGASSIAVGGLAVAAFALIDGPVGAAPPLFAADAAADAGANPQAVADVAPASTQGGSIPRISTAYSGEPTGTPSSRAGQLSRAFAPPKIPTAGVIRPLSMVPDVSSIVPPPRPTTMLTVMQPPSQPTSLGGGGGGDAPVSPGNGAAVPVAQGAAPAAPSSAGSVPPQIGANPPAFLLPAPAAPSAATSIAPAGSRAGGLPLVNGYVATPSSNAAREFYGDFHQAGGSGNGTTGASSSTDSANAGASSVSGTSPSTAGGASTSTPGYWSDTVTSQGGGSGGSGGGGGSTTYSGKLQFSGGAPTGPIYIGTIMGLVYQVTGNEGETLKPTSVTWTVSNGVFGTNQTIPNPSVADPNAARGIPTIPAPQNSLVTFQQQNFVPPAPGACAQEVYFACPSTPGDVTVTATVAFDIYVGNVKQGNSSAECKSTFPVVVPDFKYNIDYLNKAYYYDIPGQANFIGVGYYSSDGATMSGGKKWYSTNTTVRTNFVPGIDWTGVRVPPAQGQLAFEQFVDPGTSNVMKAPAPGNGTATGYYYIGPDANNNQIQKLAPFPTLDTLPTGNGVPTKPWYPAGTTDSPSINLLSLKGNYPTGTWTDNFTNAVMFQATKNGQPIGIWVPEASFTWSLNGGLTVTGRGSSTVVAKVTAPKVDHTDWPKAWQDLQYVYGNILKT